MPHRHLRVAPRATRHGPVLVGTVAILAFLAFRFTVQSALGAPASVGGQFKGFQFPYKDGEGRTTARIRGDAKPSQGQIEFTPGIIETYVGTNIDMIVEAPQCVLDRNSGIVTSPGGLSVRTTDQRFFIQGKGFRWQPTEVHLQISNEVHAVIRKPTNPAQPATLVRSTNAPPVSTPQSNPRSGESNSAPAKAETIDIHSDQFDFTPALALFNGSVRAKQEDISLICGRLKVKFSGAGGGVEEIEAEQNVVFEQEETRTTGEKAVYRWKDELITLTGHPAWKVGENEGTGDLIRINNKSRDFHVDGNVTVNLAARQMVTLDLFSRAGPTNPPAQRRPPIQIHSQRLDYTSDAAVFLGGVKIDDSLGGSLTCQVLTNLFSGPTGKLAELIAQGDVEIKQGQTGAKANRAIYRATNDLVILTGSPTWKIEEGEGRSEILTIHPKTRQIVAEGNVSLKLVNVMTNALGLTLDTPAATPVSAGSRSLDLEIAARVLRYKPGSAIFLGNVRVTSPQEPDREITSEVLAAFFRDPGNKLDELIAEDNVRVRQGKLTASGEKADYLVTKGLVELTGNPRIVREGQLYRADRFTLDRMRSTFRGTGHYRIEVEPNAAKQAVGLRSGNKP